MTPKTKVETRKAHNIDLFKHCAVQGFRNSHHLAGGRINRSNSIKNSFLVRLSTSELYPVSNFSPRDGGRHAVGFGNGIPSRNNNKKITQPSVSEVLRVKF